MPTEPIILLASAIAAGLVAGFLIFHLGFAAGRLKESQRMRQYLQHVVLPDAPRTANNRTSAPGFAVGRTRFVPDPRD